MKLLMKILFLNVLLILVSCKTTQSTSLSQDQQAANLSEEEAIKTLAEKHQIIVELRAASGIGIIMYSVTDANSKDEIATITVRYPDRVDGEYLIAAVEDLLKTPRNELKALKEANNVLFADQEILEKKYGITFISPSGWPDKDRYPDSAAQILLAHTESWDDRGGYTNLVELGKITFNKLSVFVPGRNSYPAEIIYAKGDLEAVFLKNGELWAAYQARAKANAINFNGNSSSNFDWPKNPYLGRNP